MRNPVARALLPLGLAVSCLFSCGPQVASQEKTSDPSTSQKTSSDFSVSQPAAEGAVASLPTQALNPSPDALPESLRPWASGPGWNASDVQKALDAYKSERSIAPKYLRSPETKIVQEAYPEGRFVAQGTTLWTLLPCQDSVEWEFHPEATRLDFRNAYWMAWAATNVHVPIPQVVFNELAKVGFTRFTYVENLFTGLQAIVAAGPQMVWVFYRGSIELQDWLVDFDFTQVSGESRGAWGQIHRGFYNALDSGWSALRSAIAQSRTMGQPIFVAGHSLGGAMAQLTGARLVREGFPVQGVYAFGAPRVGNEDFSRAYNAALGSRTFRFINSEDIVPRLPPPRVASGSFSSLFIWPLNWILDGLVQSMNYTHVASRMHFGAQGHSSLLPTYEAADNDYWNMIRQRSAGVDPVTWVLRNASVLIDHLPNWYQCGVAKALAKGEISP